MYDQPGSGADRHARRAGYIHPRTENLDTVLDRTRSYPSSPFSRTYSSHASLGAGAHERGWTLHDTETLEHLNRHGLRLVDIVNRTGNDVWVPAGPRPNLLDQPRLFVGSEA